MKVYFPLDSPLIKEDRDRQFHGQGEYENLRFDLNMGNIWIYIYMCQNDEPKIHEKIKEARMPETRTPIIQIHPSIQYRLFTFHLLLF